MNQPPENDSSLPFNEPPIEREETISHDKLEDGVACCLSGGGFRAMAFHLGFLWRLNEAQILKETQRFSSVSGGSITSALLGLRWNQLKSAGFGQQAFVDLVVTPIRHFATKSVDVPAVGWGTLNPFSRISDQVADAYDKHLFHGKTLQDLPDEPRWVINATNVKSGVLWRFSKPYMADYRVGRIPNPDVRLADAVAASSAFPPYLSPFVMKVDPNDFATDEPAELEQTEYRRDAVLTDGGVYDNLGLETAIKRYRTLLVSDGGRSVKPEADPKEDWARHSYRMIELLQQQVSSLRRRQLIASFKSKTYSGVYCGIQTDTAKFPPAAPLSIDRVTQLAIADIDTRLAPISDSDQKGLINLGYAVCDAVVRAHWKNDLPAPSGFPYPDRPI